MLLYLHATTPDDPATSRENLSDQSPCSILTAAFFFPKKFFALKEKRTGPLKLAGWCKTFTFSSELCAKI